MGRSSDKSFIMCEYCGYAPNQCYVKPTIDEEYKMPVDVRDGLGNVKVEGEMINKVGLRVVGLSHSAEVVLSRNTGDAVHTIYFRLEYLETVEVYSTGFGSETNFTQFDSVADLEEYLAYLIFQDNYMVIGGLWQDTISVSLNAAEVLHE